MEMLEITIPETAALIDVFVPNPSPPRFVLLKRKVTIEARAWVVVTGAWRASCHRVEPIGDSQPHFLLVVILEPALSPCEGKA